MAVSGRDVVYLFVQSDNFSFSGLFRLFHLFGGLDDLLQSVLFFPEFFHLRIEILIHLISPRLLNSQLPLHLHYQCFLMPQRLTHHRIQFLISQLLLKLNRLIS